MERIVDTLEMQKVLPDSYADKLKVLGMRDNDYPMITNNAIEEFLTKHLKKTFPPKDRHGSITMEFNLKVDKHSGIRHKISTPIIHRETITKRGLWGDKTIETENREWTGYQWWDEIPLGEYNGNPPERILTSALKAKNLGYKKLAVVITNARVVEDPLLIGFKNGKRYLIDFWDKDFTADEIIALVENKK